MEAPSINLDKAIEKALNEQISQENEASFCYLQMAIWAEANHYPGAATFLYQQSEEEREHMLKIVHYLTDLDIQPSMPAYKAAQPNYNSLETLFKAVLQSEQQVTHAIHKLVELCLAKKDFATFEFLQWFVKEQREEEATARKALGLFSLVEQSSIGLYTIDQALKGLKQ